MKADARHGFTLHAHLQTQATLPKEPPLPPYRMIPKMPQYQVLDNYIIQKEIGQFGHVKAFFFSSCLNFISCPLQCTAHRNILTLNSSIYSPGTGMQQMNPRYSQRWCRSEWATTFIKSPSVGGNQPRSQTVIS